MNIIKVLLLFLTLNVFAQEQYVEMGAKTFKKESKTYLAVLYKNTKGWHTYWKNPGDAGLSMQLTISSNGKKIDLKDLPWPAPKRYIEGGDMWTYGYSGDFIHYYELDDGHKNTTLELLGEWLVCKDICIPGKRNITLSLDNELNGETNAFLKESTILEKFAKLPKINSNPNIKFYINKDLEEKKLSLHYVIENVDLDQIRAKANVITPYQQEPFDYGHEKLYFDRTNKTLYGNVKIDWDGEYSEPVYPLPENGIFKEPITASFLLQYPKNQNAQIVSNTFTSFSLSGEQAMQNQYKMFEQLSDKTLKATQDNNKKSIWSFILFAFLGGLILNLMPCVLPVISLKLFGLIVHSDEDKGKVLKHNLSYTAGVISTFLSLGVVVLLLKSSGEQIGWGFQLQSPLFVFAMTMIIFIMAMNMLGLFEFITPGGKTLGNKQLKEGFIGDFSNGILATILSTPCSAPFLGAALTFAFTTSSINIFIIFFFVGLGLAFPFIMTGIFPQTIKFLPKPGLWMDKLKKILGLTLLLTFVWLYDVLSTLINMDIGGIYINTIFIMTFFAFYFRAKVSKHIVWNVLFFILPAMIFTYTLTNNMYTTRTTQTVSSTSNLSWEKWTPEKMVSNSDGYVFANFTANWCLTCKVNKKLVLDTDAFETLTKEKNIKLLEADWTKRDEVITNYLRKYNIVGVPAYFIVKPSGEVISLGETISISKIEKNLN